VFIDEAQRVPDIGWGLKLLIDNRPELEIIATGSSSFDLAGKPGEPLTGRQVPLKLYPLSIGELGRTLDLFNNPVGYFTSLGKMLRILLFLAEVVQKLKFLNNSILELERIKRPQVLIRLLTLIALQVGGEVSLNELSNQLGIDMKTVERYLDLLMKCFVLYNLRGFSRNLRNEVTKKSKYYFYDTGIRNAVIQNYNPLSLRNDAGALWENFMVIERLKARSYSGLYARDYFWRTWEKQEIDLIEDYGGRLHGYEIKWTPGANQKIPSAFRENYPDAVFQTVSPGNFLDFLNGA
jgi:predicted AAA+ superfamily ATPase